MPNITKSEDTQFLLGVVFSYNISVFSLIFLIASFIMPNRILILYNYLK